MISDVVKPAGDAAPKGPVIALAWAAFTEDVVLEWVRDDRGITRDQLLVTLSASLPGILAPLRQG